MWLPLIRRGWRRAGTGVASSRNCATQAPATFATLRASMDSLRRRHARGGTASACPCARSRVDAGPRHHAGAALPRIDAHWQRRAAHRRPSRPRRRIPGDSDFRAAAPAGCWRRSMVCEPGRRRRLREVIVEKQPGADHPRRPQVRVVRQHESQRPGEVRRRASTTSRSCNDLRTSSKSKCSR